MVPIMYFGTMYGIPACNDAGNPESGDSYGADNLLKSRQGVYVRKKSDDLDVNSSPLYKYVALDIKGAAPFLFCCSVD